MTATSSATTVALLQSLLDSAVANEARSIAPLPKSEKKRRQRALTLGSNDPASSPAQSPTPQRAAVPQGNAPQLNIVIPSGVASPPLPSSPRAGSTLGSPFSFGNIFRRHKKDSDIVCCPSLLLFGDSLISFRSNPGHSASIFRSTLPRPRIQSTLCSSSKTSSDSTRWRLSERPLCLSANLRYDSQKRDFAKGETFFSFVALCIGRCL